MAEACEPDFLWARCVKGRPQMASLKHQWRQCPLLLARPSAPLLSHQEISHLHLILHSIRKATDGNHRCPWKEATTMVSDLHTAHPIRSTENNAANTRCRGTFQSNSIDYVQISLCWSAITWSEIQRQQRGALVFTKGFLKVIWQVLCMPSFHITNH